jgi:hypothetical protein
MTLISLFVTFLLYALAFGIAWWIVSILPGPPIVKVIGWVIIGLAALFIVLQLAQGGVPMVQFRGF